MEACAPALGGLTGRRQRREGVPDVAGAGTRVALAQLDISVPNEGNKIVSLIHSRSKLGECSKGRDQIHLRDPSPPRLPWEAKRRQGFLIAGLFVCLNYFTFNFINLTI